MSIAYGSETESILVNDFGDQFLYSINGDSFYKENAKDIFNKTFGNQFWNENTYHIVIGTDSGLLIQYLIEHGMPKDSCYLFIELPQYIDLIRPDLPEEWQKKLKFCTPQEWIDNFEQANLEPYLYLEKALVHRSLAVTEVNNPDYHQARVAVESTYQDRVLGVKKVFGNLIFVNRQITNAVDNRHSTLVLKDAFQDKTCIILGGGPSLDLHLDWINEHRANLVVIAVARITKKLLAENLIPDLVVSVDPHLVSYDNSKEIMMLPNHVVLVNSYHVVPSLRSQWAGKAIYAGELLPWESSLNSDSGSYAGPTVVNAALAFALDLGFKSVLLTGADLCHSASGASHATGSFEADKGIDISCQGKWVDTYAGGKAETTINFALATTMLGMQAKYATSLGCQVYNLSINAAKVDNISFIALQDIQLSPLKQPASDIISQLIPDDNGQLIRQHLNALGGEFNKVQHDLSEIKRLASDAIITNQKMCDSQSSEKVQTSNKRKLDKIERKLSQRYGYLSALIKKVAISDFVKILGDGDAHSWNNADIEKKGRLYYQAYINGVAIISELVAAAQQRLVVRIEAEKSDPNIDVLYDYWTAQREYGCFKIWANNHPKAVGGSAHKIKLLLDKSTAALVEYHQNIDSRYANQTTSLTEVPLKIRNLFFEQNTNGLALIISQLTSCDSSQPEAAGLLSLANGYYYLLLDKLAESLAAFKEADEQILHELEYKHMAAIMITLELYDEAEALLSKLSLKIDIHLPLYASILKINGKQELAVDAYACYLEKHNTDLKVWCDLGQLFTEMGIGESAKMAYEFVLQQEPDNKVATRWLQKLSESGLAI